MVIVRLQGGLGNQMFQYAAARALSIRRHTHLKFDITHLLDRSPSLNIVFRDYDLDIFPNITRSIATKEDLQALNPTYLKSELLTRMVRKTIGVRSYFKEKSPLFDSAFKTLPSNVYLDGFWQSEKYFEAEKAVIKQDFAFAPLSLSINMSLLYEIENTNSVCLNVRRGDFVSHPGSSSFHGFKGLDYIEKAVALIEEKVSNPHFYIFSDDIEWCRENIILTHPFTIVNHEHAGQKFADYMQLMTACKHFIIPNSSFAWWAAWLSTQPNKVVVAPLAWFNDPSINTSDIIPPTWLRT